MILDSGKAEPGWLVRMRCVPGWLEEEEGLLLHALAVERHGLGRCVELGAYQGRSAIALASALPEGSRVLSVDTFAGSPEHQPGQSYFNPRTLDSAGIVDTLDLFRGHLAAAGLAHRVEAWRMTTHEAAARFEGAVALLFVDADHHYSAVCADVAAWRPRMAPGGVLVLHDVGDWEGPTRCAADLLAMGCTRLAQAGTALALATPSGWASA